MIDGLSAFKATVVLAILAVWAILAALSWHFFDLVGVAGLSALTWLVAYFLSEAFPDDKEYT